MHQAGPQKAMDNTTTYYNLSFIKQLRRAKIMAQILEKNKAETNNLGRSLFGGLTILLNSSLEHSPR